MNKKALIGIVILLLLFVGVGAIVMSNKNKMSPTTSSELTQTPFKASPKSMKELLTLGVPQMCKFNDSTSGTEGTTYIAGGKVRGDFKSTVEGKESVGHMIFDGKTNYIWMDDSKTGFKMDVDPATLNSEGKPQQQGLDFNKSMDYNCTVWVADENVFEAPSDVTFSEFSIPASGASGESMNDNQKLCASCNSLTGDQKTQCLTALKCS